MLHQAASLESTRVVMRPLFFEPFHQCSRGFRIKLESQLFPETGLESPTSFP